MVGAGGGYRRARVRGREGGSRSAGVAFRAGSCLLLPGNCAASGEPIVGGCHASCFAWKLRCNTQSKREMMPVRRSGDANCASRNSNTLLVSVSLDKQRGDDAPATARLYLKEEKGPLIREITTQLLPAVR